MKILLIAGLIVLVAACQPSGTGGRGSPSPGTEGVEALVGDLSAAGASVNDGGTFSPDPLSGQGVLLCVGGEPVRVYVFGSPAERSQVASRIKPSDPSNIGTSIVEWMGTPRFWQRDRVLVLYLGQNPATETLLSSLLGEPFAKGRAGRAPLRGDSCT